MTPPVAACPSYRRPQPSGASTATNQTTAGRTEHAVAAASIQEKGVDPFKPDWRDCENDYAGVRFRKRSLNKCGDPSLRVGILAAARRIRAVLVTGINWRLNQRTVHHLFEARARLQCHCLIGQIGPRESIQVNSMSGDDRNPEPGRDVLEDSSQTERSLPPKPPIRPSWIRLSGAGMELAAITVVMGGLGLWLDSYFETEKPLWSALLGLIGFSYGIYRFIRLAQKISESERESDRRRLADKQNRDRT